MFSHTSHLEICIFRGFLLLLFCWLFVISVGLFILLTTLVAFKEGIGSHKVRKFWSNRILLFEPKTQCNVYQGWANFVIFWGISRDAKSSELGQPVRAIFPPIFANLWPKRLFYADIAHSFKNRLLNHFLFQTKRWYFITRRMEYFIQIGKWYFWGVGLRKSPRTRYILLATQHLYALPLVFWVNKTLLHWNVMHLFCYHIFQMILFPKI